MISDELDGVSEEGDHPDFSGTPSQQALQRSVAAYYADDPRILAVGIFGSLGRGNWHQDSDLDLDVVLADHVQVDVLEEVRSLCASFSAIDEFPLLIIPDGDDAADAVLASLRGLSIRFHPLSTTSPNIVDSLQLLTGSLSLDAIRMAGTANRTQSDVSLEQLLDRVVRWTIDVEVGLYRGNFWQVSSVLQRMREHLLTIFMLTHDGVRPYHTFDSQAPLDLQSRVGATLHPFGLAAARSAFIAMLDLIEGDLSRMSSGKLRLSSSQAEVITRVRQRFDSRDQPR